jgi:hypothetical protein
MMAADAGQTSVVTLLLAAKALVNIADSVSSWHAVICISDISHRLCMSFSYGTFWHYDVEHHHMTRLPVPDFADSVSLYNRAARRLYSKRLSQAICQWCRCF